MLIKIFTVYDSKIEAYLPPFYEQSTGAAVRAFAEASNEKDHQFNKYPADFTLFQIGTYEDSTALIESFTSFTNLGTALENQTPETPMQQIHEV